MANLSTTYLGLDLANPLVVSASPLSDDLETLRELEEAGAAAVVMRSLFEEQIEQEAMAYHRILEEWSESFTEAQSYFPDMQDFRTGPRQFIDAVEAAKRALKIPVIGSLNGVSTGGWVRYARYMEDAGVDALELNVYFVAADPSESSAAVEERYIELLQAVRDVVNIPIAVKVGPFFSSMAHMANRLAEAGADGLVLFNRFLQPDIDLEKLSVEPGVRLSTSQELRLPLRWIAILHGRVNASLAATSGVHTAADATKVLLAGADVAMMASALLMHGPRHIADMLQDLAAWLDENEYESVAQMKGSLSQLSCPDPAAFERSNYMLGLTSYHWRRETRRSRRRELPTLLGVARERLAPAEAIGEPAPYEPVGRDFQQVQEALRGDFFSRIPAPAAARICENAVHMRAPARVQLDIESMEPAAALVVSGLLRVYITTPSGSQPTVRYVGPGGVIGLASAVAGEHLVNVQAVHPSKVMLVPRSRIVAEAKRDPVVAWAVADEASRRYAELLGELADLSSASLQQRLARHLLLLAEPSGRSDGTLVVNLTQSDLAGVVGVSPEEASRAFRALRDERAIGTLSSGGIAIHDPAALQRLASKSA
jgi:dihydroorotate dehydrogenase (fumarate)